MWLYCVGFISMRFDSGSFCQMEVLHSTSGDIVPVLVWRMHVHERELPSISLGLLRCRHERCVVVQSQVLAQPEEHIGSGGVRL